MTRDEFLRAVDAAVDAAYAGEKASARKTGRDRRWPYVPIVVHDRGGRPREEQLLGLAFAEREDAVRAAALAISNRRITLRARLMIPSLRALREGHGLPREIPS